MSKDESEPFRAVFDLALDSLVHTLKDAQQYVDQRNDAAAIGTLHNLNELYSDVNTALHLFKNRRTL